MVGRVISKRGASWEERGFPGAAISKGRGICCGEGVRITGGSSGFGRELHGGLTSVEGDWDQCGEGNSLEFGGQWRGCNSLGRVGVPPVRGELGSVWGGNPWEDPWGP